MNKKNITISYEQFLTLLTKCLQKKFGTGYQLIPQKILKTNGIVQHSLTLINGNCSIAPCICIDTFYFDYINENRMLDDIAETLFQSYKLNEVSCMMDTATFMDWHQIKNWIRCRLINTEKNSVLLSEVPHREFLDLSIVYYLQVELSNDMKGTIHIRNEHMRLWNTDEKTLYLKAWQNMHSTEDATICDLNDIIHSTLEEDQTINSLLLPGQMHILSNQRKLYGAVHMTDLKQMSKIASEIDNDLLILPASIHEVIIIPYDRINHTATLADIVAKINITELAPDEILSSHVYYFNRDTVKISIIA